MMGLYDTVYIVLSLSISLLSLSISLLCLPLRSTAQPPVMYSCLTNWSAQHDLGFVKPNPSFVPEGDYPPSYIPSKVNRLVWLECCSTGFTHINWYKNGDIIPADTPESVAIRFQDGQILGLRFYESDPRLNNMTCQLVKNENTTLSHDFLIEAHPVCSDDPPTYTIVPKSSVCASPGDTVTIYCEVLLPRETCIHPFFYRLRIEADVGGGIAYVHNTTENFKNTYSNEKRLDERTWHTELTFYNITQAQMSLTYHCVIPISNWTKTTFKFTTPCEEDRETKLRDTKNYFDKTFVARVSVSLVTLFLVSCILGVVGYMYRIEIKHLWNTCINPSYKGSMTYDGYLIVSQDDEDQQFMMDNILSQLEECPYKICVPDRDFLIGSVVPEKMSEHVQNSRRVLVILTTSLLQTDYCDLSLSTALVNNIPLIFIRPPNQSDEEEELLKELIDENQELSAALTTSTVLKYPDKSSKLESFYNNLYRAMPLALQAPVSQDQLKISEVG